MKILFYTSSSLDTFPYAGTTTTCESLYMGVPCVTMAGLVHANNVGVTLLHQVGNTLVFYQLLSCDTTLSTWGLKITGIFLNHK